MTRTASIRRILLSACAGLAIATAALVAQTPQAPATPPFQPQVGQQGKDVVWVPTADVLVAKMLDMAQVTANDLVMDLGSGDGRTVIAAARRGARAIGVEFNPDMVALSRFNAEQAGLTDRASFINADLFETDFSKATVVTLFLLNSLNLKLRPILLDMPPGTRVVSNTFDMGDWTPDETTRVEGECTSWCTAHFWVVPAKVAGTWRLPDGEIVLDQEYQRVSGTLRTGGSAVPLTGRLRGVEITFTAGGTTYTGQVNGNAMQGAAGGAGGRAWSASRVRG